MRVWFDTEFIDNGETIDLLSLGAIREDGREFYGINLDADRSKAVKWVKDHVLSVIERSAGDVFVRTNRNELAREFKAFIGPPPPNYWELEFWTYYGAYDWVALCQLYGTMMELPTGWPKYHLDLRQWVHQRGMSKIEFGGEAETAMRGGLPEHHALGDARWNAAVYGFLLRTESERS